MPDEISLKDIFEKLVKIETLLSQIPKLNTGAIIEDKGDNPFYDPDKQTYRVGFYKQNHPADEEK